MQNSESSKPLSFFRGIAKWYDFQIQAVQIFKERLFRRLNSHQDTMNLNSSTRQTRASLKMAATPAMAALLVGAEGGGARRLLAKGTIGAG